MEQLKSNKDPLHVSNVIGPSLIQKIYINKPDLWFCFFPTTLEIVPFLTHWGSCPSGLRWLDQPPPAWYLPVVLGYISRNLRQQAFAKLTGGFWKLQTSLASPRLEKFGTGLIIWSSIILESGKRRRRNYRKSQRHFGETSKENKSNPQDC